MKGKKGKFKNRFEGPEWLRIAGIILAYGLTIGGIVFVIPWLFSFSESWAIGLLLLVIVAPLFPAMQAILLKEKPANLFMFLKIYVAEFASLFLRFCNSAFCW